MPRIFLVGNAAAGKTTFGRALSRHLHLEFIDLDAYIENRFHTTINAIFATHGEEHFRKLESSMLHEVGEFENVIVACGGGTPCHFDNMDWMCGHGTTVWIQATAARIVARLMRNRSKRPMFRDLDEAQIEAKVVQMMQLREPYYSKAQIHFSGEELETRHEIQRAVEAFVAAHPLQ